METEFTIYQTLKDKGNHLECEIDGPYDCNWSNTWLGNGYYFWYHHIELAKWWGKSKYGAAAFVIYKSTCVDLSLCWDLHCGPHQTEFLYWLKILKEKKLFKTTTTVAQVVEFIKNECPTFTYEAIRILGTDSLSSNSAKRNKLARVKFETPLLTSPNNAQRYLSYYDITPPIQVCLFTKNALKRQGFEVVFPEKYLAQNRIEDFYI